ncbi:MAG: N5-glutamine methyltransferase family protein [Bdellovibrionia bacterium]
MKASGVSQELLRFHEALDLARTLLSQSRKLVEEARVSPEASILVLEAYRFATGQKLSSFEFLQKLESRAQPEFPRQAQEQLQLWCQRRVQGEPLQYLTRVQTFFDHEYCVGPEVLVPRPETEVLLQTALDQLTRSGSSPALGLEIGLGSGVLSIELLSRFPSLRMVASEVSEKAQGLALKNATAVLGETSLGAARLKVLQPLAQTQVFECFDRFCNSDPRVSFRRHADFLISNPPYLVHENEVDPEVLSYEPHVALFAPEGDALFFYRKICDQAHLWVRTGGWIFLELPHERAKAIEAMFQGGYAQVKLISDLTGRPRVLAAQVGSWDGNPVQEVQKNDG